MGSSSDSSSSAPSSRRSRSERVCGQVLATVRAIVALIVMTAILQLLRIAARATMEDSPAEKLLQDTMSVAVETL